MDFVEVDETVPQERISVRSGDKSQGPSLQRIVEQMIDVSETWMRGLAAYGNAVSR